jgi:hypothetical protein
LLDQGVWPLGRASAEAAGRTGPARITEGTDRVPRLQGDWTDPVLGRITFGEYALAWLDSRADLKPKTRHQYRSLLALPILPTWRTVPLAKITFEGLTQWVAWMSLGGLGASFCRLAAAPG